MKTGSGAARVSLSDGATAQAVCLPWVSGLTDACTHVGGDGDGTDFRLSRNGDGAVPVSAHSLREWREAMVRWFAYLGLPATPMLARMFAWVGCDPIFDCRETEMGPRNSHLETLKENADCR